MAAREVVFLSGVRTAIGDFGGSLKDQPPCDLGAKVVSEAVSRAGLEGKDVGHVVFGNVIHTEARDMYLARVCAVNGGIPIETPAMTLNRLCGSGLQAIVSAAQNIMLGDTDCALAGGAENMSRSPYWSMATRFGQRMGDAQMIDVMTAALHDPFHACHMGITAENIAKKYGITRQAQDELAATSHKRAANAVDKGYFDEQILPIDIRVKRDTVAFTKDEHVRADVTAESLGKLRPVFDKEGSVTVGNSSGINDAAAAVVMMEAAEAEKRGLEPMAKLIGYSHAGVEPEYMGMGPVPAIQSLLQKTGISKDDIDVIELNEAFAAQALGVVKELGLSLEKTNPNGSGVSLGHPIGATGCLLTVKAMYELQRTAGRYALISMCIGGGQGIAAIIERV
ncbi:MAG: acetyl-CoA C-acyltransferase family protein [Arenicellales bacterium WSBS_2016_MAG_OTU3]